MKTGIYLLSFLLLFTFANGCSSNSGKKSVKGEADSLNATNAADTGFNGITQYFSQGRLVKEVTFKNGIRNGLMKTFDASGKLYQTFWYENGKRQDTAVWFFDDGKIFRKTPFKDDSINGIQIQYYKTGKTKARLGFVNGLRTMYFEEYDPNGNKITDYPELAIKISDEYKQNGTFKIILGLSKTRSEANFYSGELMNGLFNSKKCVKVNDSKSTGLITLKKTGEAGTKSVGIIAEILTPFGNRNLVYKKIDIPYSNLK